MLKKARIMVSLVVFICLSTGFIFSSHWVLNLANSFQSFQLIPVVLRVFFEFSLISLMILFFLLILTLIFGRIYCSFLCPLGFLQDIAGFFKRKIKPFSHHYQKPLYFIKYGLLVIVLLTILIHTSILVNLLDPYSAFGRIGSNLFLPLWSFVQGFLSGILEKFEIYSLAAFTKIIFQWKVFVYTILFTLGLLMISFFKGRFYCNTLCPAGAFLGFISRISLFKIQFIKERCTKCGLCEKSCKASCIVSQKQKIDPDQCVNCFNCLQVCPESALKYTFTKEEKETDLNLRSALKKGGIIAGTLAAAALFPIKLISGFKKNPILPPGAVSIERFRKACSACHRCVSACPTRVIEPGMLQNGFAGIFQPALNYSKSFCEYECNQCTKVCPTNALKKISLEEKKKVQIGIVNLNKNKCLVYQKEEICGACAEVCPTRAVFVYEYKKELYAPLTEPEYCVGCGACEFACPVRPERAITVDGNPLQLIALKPKEKEKILKKEAEKKRDKKEFPF